MVKSSWNVMTHGDAREGKGKLANGVGNQYPSLPRNLVYPSLLPLMHTPRLPVADWTAAPDDLNWLVRFAERQNLGSARVPSHFKRSLQPHFYPCTIRHSTYLTPGACPISLYCVIITYKNREEWTGRPCSAYGGQEGRIQGFGRETWG
jgi:hypothetical protein